MSIMKYIENHETNPFYNLALEEYVLKNRTDDDYLLLWRNAPTVVIGRHQNMAEEVERSVAERYHVKLVRRESGGGAVYHDLGNLNYSFITDLSKTETMTFEEFTKPVIKVLEKLGLQAQFTGRNDILINEKKISGNAQAIKGGRILSHGTLLFDLDLDMAQKILCVNAAKIQSRSTKSIRSRIGNIKDCLPCGCTMDIIEFKQLLITTLGSHMDQLETTEIETIKKLEMEKYRTWQWNYGESPDFDFSNQRKYEGGILRVDFRFEEGKITGIKFWGDFMSKCPLEVIEHEICKMRYERESIRHILEKFDLNKYFGTITKDEILACMFP